MVKKNCLVEIVDNLVDLKCEQLYNVSIFKIALYILKNHLHIKYKRIKCTK